MNFIKIRNTCKGCPYLQTPAVDLHKIDQYYTCRQTYANTYDLDLKKEKKMISSFIDNYFFGVD